MGFQSLITDNIAEVLVKIIEFTNIRQKILTENLNNFHKPNYIPKDLDVDEFSDLLHNAIDEHESSQMLLLCDTDGIKFGADGSFSVKAADDIKAVELLKKSKDEYIEMQTNKLLENAINQRLAAELLRHKQQMISIVDNT